MNFFNNTLHIFPYQNFQFLLMFFSSLHTTGTWWQNHLNSFCLVLAGVSQLIVAVNKMDTVDWSKVRFEEISRKLGAFLKQAGFKESDVSYVPCSGLSGENLAKPASEPALTQWYSGPCIAQLIGIPHCGCWFYKVVLYLAIAQSFTNTL